MSPFARIACRPGPGGRRRGALPARARALPVVLAAVLTVLAAGCGDDDPALPPAAPPPDAGAAYVPAAASVTVVRDGWLDFRVTATDGHLLKVRWQRPGEPEAAGERFRYFARSLGSETLAARVEAPDGAAWTRTWAVVVVPPGSPRVDFLPEGAQVTAYATVETVFAVASPWPLAAAAWSLDGAAAGTDTLLRLVPEAAGPRTVAVTAAAGDSTFTHAWSVDVRPFAEARPPAVTGLAAAPGDAPGRAVLAWDRTDGSVLPVASYEVRYRWDGPPTEATWAADRDPGSYPWSDAVRTTAYYTPGNAGLEPGRDTWFAVRARNTRGQLSPLGEPVLVRVPGEWWVEGTVRGPDGSPLAGVTVADAGRLRASLTGPDGRYRVGPFFELAPAVLEAGTAPDAPAGASWHWQRSGTLTADGPRAQDFLLIPRLGSAPDCFVFGSHFLAYLRTMTKTRVATPLRPDVRLYHWPEYPLAVHVPDWVSERGVDYGACVRDALAVWNESLGEPWFVTVDDPAAARLVFRYDLVGDINYAAVELDQPGDGAYILGDVVPERASVRLTPAMPHAQICTEIALHELGHALGLHNHAQCQDVPYAMYVSAVGLLDRPRDQVIHPDERRAVRLIRMLPNGLDMATYPLDLP